LDKLIPVSSFGFPNLWAERYGADLIIARGDVGELARAMQRFCKDRKLDSQMGWVGQRRIKGRFDPKKNHQSADTILSEDRLSSLKYKP
jgi:hypothetical protein